VTRDVVYLRHSADAAEKIEAYASVGQGRFLAESHWQDAVIRQLEIIGEATKRLSEAIRDQSPDVPWRRIAGMRDVLSHDYFRVDLSAVGEVTQKEVPFLARRVKELIIEAEIKPGD
jgi:uncharacterized protein with HEPN domain